MDNHMNFAPERLHGATVFTADGEKIGRVDDVFSEHVPENGPWVAVQGGPLGLRRTLVPTQGARFEGDDLHLAYTQEQVKNAPELDTTRMGTDSEHRIYEHYGMTWDHTDTQGWSEGGASSDENSVVTHEEELDVGKREVSAGTARLSKWVSTEPVSEDITLKRETAEVTREPINEVVDPSANSFEEEDIEVSLTAEEPVVQKDIVAKEKVSLDKDVVHETEVVTDTVRSEHADIEGDGVDDTDSSCC